MKSAVEVIQLLGLWRGKGKEPGDWEAGWARILILPFYVCRLSHIYCSPQMHEWGTGLSMETIDHMFTQHMGQPSREPSPSCQWNRVVKKITGLGGSVCAMNVLVSNVNLLTNPTSAYKVATGLMLCREESGCQPNVISGTQVSHKAGKTLTYIVMLVLGAKGCAEESPWQLSPWSPWYEHNSP